MTEPPQGPPAPTEVPTCYQHPERETWIRCQRCNRPICPDCMRDAAVGFQCPSCVAEGARSTRSGRTAYGGLRSSNPGATSLALIVVNAAVWVLITVTGGFRSAWVDRLALLADGRCANAFSIYPPRVGEQVCPLVSPNATWVPGVLDGAWWQVGTSMFTHVEAWHIGFNMLALWFLGPQLEMALGRWRFLALYLLSGLWGSAFVLWLSSPSTQTVGASGAIFGLMGALLVVGIKVRGNVQPILLWIGINVVITVVGRGLISWQGHLGGLLGGVVVAAVLVYAPRGRRTVWQAIGLASLTALALLALVARALV